MIEEIPKEEQLLALVPQDGTGIGNTRLMRELDWPEEEFWEVRNRLVDRGVLELGRGRGGSVRNAVLPQHVPLNVSATPAVAAAGLESETAAPHKESEADLYLPAAKVIEEIWVKDKRVESAIVRVTAQQGSKSTGGRWTRPDITVATLSTYPYVPGRHFDVITFEIKPSVGIDVTCVYEALAHLRSATKAYVLLSVPEGDGELDEVMLEVVGEAKKHGVGVITFTDPSNYDTWEERVEPVRREPEPRKLNDFLAKQFAQEQLEKLVKWFR